MENKKQLIISPPMSEPLQKLNEVLNGIATDENIEISLIEDLKELSQFLGTAGQCLISFSNAKKCATFLQENRFIIAKTHTKVILLTPKEIPAKTLIKFTKIGLTEAILETSAPKTLLYKVKLLMRSIKTTVNALDDKDRDQIIKSSDTPQTAANKGEMNIDRLQNEEAVEEVAIEEKKIKVVQEENVIDYGGNLKGKATNQDDSIETHWKSNRKKELNGLYDESENEANNIEGDNDDIDMFYRGKQKRDNNSPEDSEEDLYGKKKTYEEEAPADYLKKKVIEEVDLGFSLAKKPKNHYVDEDDTAAYKLKKGTTLELEPGAAEEDEEPQYNEADEEEKRKALLELDLLFEEAKKRQNNEEAEDLGGHYKGDILNNTPEEEEADITEEREAYDNSDLSKKEKPFELDLIASEEEKNPYQNQEEDEETKKNKGFKENIESLMNGEEGQVDHIETYMMSDIGEDKSKNIDESAAYDLNKVKKEEELAVSEDEETEDDEVNESESIALTKKVKDQDVDEPLINDSTSEKEDLGEKWKGKVKTNENEEETDNANDKKNVNLTLLPGEAEELKRNISEESDFMAFKKLNQTDLGLEKDRDDKNHGKVDKIDSFYRSSKAKKKEHDWDINDKKQKFGSGPEKAARKEDETLTYPGRSDGGETTIDYRKLKEEFEGISRGESFGDASDLYGESGARNPGEEEDGSFKVVELEARGFDFAIEIINLLYLKDSKAPDFYKSISAELISRYKAYPTFYQYKSMDKKHTEVYDGMTALPTPEMDEEARDYWFKHRKTESVFQDYFSKSMLTWICRDLPNKKGTNTYWEDIELPSWAANELTNKKVEMVFPYFDGLDRMGTAVLYFPDGVNPSAEKDIEVTMELARTVLLDTIQRAQTQSTPSKRDEPELIKEKSEKKNILGLFSGFFKGKKAS
jgi:hypothetical protein